MEYLYREIELPLCEVLASMEVLGFAVDIDGISAFGQMLDKQIDELKTEIMDLAGIPFNFNSTQQLAEVLFNRLGLPPQKKSDIMPCARPGMTKRTGAIWTCWKRRATACTSRTS